MCLAMSFECNLPNVILCSCVHKKSHISKMEQVIAIVWSNISCTVVVLVYIEEVSRFLRK